MFRNQLAYKFADKYGFLYRLYLSHKIDTNFEFIT